MSYGRALGLPAEVIYDNERVPKSSIPGRLEIAKYD
jgi:hypothetical protein